MAWDQLWIDKPHLAYALIGGFTTVFSLISLFVKEKLYIGEATVATIFGVIVGPHALNWFSPTTWGNTDYITLEISRIVLIVQIFAVAVELPKKYMLKHWLSVTIFLLPIMTFGWLISSVFIWKLIPTLSWVEGLAIAACVTATDPVLASAVVGKGKFAKRVPGHLRNLLSAESGCNDGMAFPFAYLALNCIKYSGQHGDIAFHFIVITVLYECVFGCILGAVIGYSGRHLIKFAEKHNLIDRESFLSFYFVLALFCTGVGSIIGTDDLLVAFAAGTAFSWDGWFSRKTEESHVSDVIDLLINMSFFVYFGAIVPWEQFNNIDIGIQAWKLVILAILILLFRRLPIMLAMKPFTPDIRTWREALFCGHFGPIGVGAIFISILSRAELESGEPTPLKEIPAEGTPHYFAIATIWPITTFLVIASILVHGSSIAVFALGKRLNNMTITMSYTTGGNNQSWLQRLPRIEGGKTLSIHKVDTEEPSTANRLKFGSKAKPIGGMKKKKWSDQPRDRPETTSIYLSGDRTDEDNGVNGGTQAFQEGHHIIVEDPQGEVITDIRGSGSTDEEAGSGSTAAEGQSSGVEKVSDATQLAQKRHKSGRPSGQGRKVVAYQLDDTIIVENDEGEIVRRYRINRRNSATGAPQHQQPQDGLKNLLQGFDKTLSWVGLKRQDSQVQHQVGSSSSPNAPASTSTPPAAHHDVEKQEHVDDDLVRIGGGENEEADLSVDEDTMKNQLKSFILQQQPAQPSATAAATAPSAGDESLSPTDRLPRNFLGPAQGSDEDNDNANIDVEDEEETEVERKRRLAALGLTDSNDADSDDEEDSSMIHRSPTHTASPVVPPVIREEDEEDNGNSPGGIKWSSDVKR